MPDSWFRWVRLNCWKRLSNRLAFLPDVVAALLRYEMYLLSFAPSQEKNPNDYI